MSLASGTAVQGGSVSLNLSLSASSASALQWTLSYAAANVTSVSVAAGPALTAAGKTIQCRTTTGATVCLASGSNSTTIANGVVAVVTATLAPTSSPSVPISVGGTLGSLGAGTALAVTGTGGTITVQGSPPPPDTTAPSIPTNLSATAISSSQINLAWTASTDNVATTGYKVFRAGVQIATVTTGTAYQNTGLTAGTAYAYTVSAYDAAGNNSAQSASVSVTTQAAADTTAPSIPTNLSATAISGSQINLAWTASTDNVATTGYKVSRAGIQIATVTTGTAYQNTGLTAGTAYAYTVSAYDAAGNNSAQSASVSATTQAAPPPTGTSIWSSSTVPSTPWYNDAPATLGVKFRSDVSGSVTGIRFYKGAGNNGTHIGLLYSSTGTPLAQATFSGETASGWQQVNFSSAVSIAANTTYIAAFFSPSGFALNTNYFTSSGVDNPPLHALRSGVDGPNSVYMYGAAPQFPSVTYGDSNYWVDLLFTAN